MEQLSNPAHPASTNVKLAVGATIIATLGVFVLVARDQSVIDAWHAAGPPVRNLLSAIAASWQKNGGADAIVFGT